MTTVRLLANVGEYERGAVISLSDDRAGRLVRTGYAERLDVKPPRKAKEAADGGAVTRH